MSVDLRARALVHGLCHRRQRFGASDGKSAVTDYSGGSGVESRYFIWNPIVNGKLSAGMGGIKMKFTAKRPNCVIAVGASTGPVRLF